MKSGRQQSAVGNQPFDSAHGRQSAAGRGAFTLIELMVVVMIIGLLVGILVPAVNKFIVVSRGAKTLSAINLIDGACRYYYDDFGDYPPSSNSAYSGWFGSQLIVLYLTGYGPDSNGDGVPGGTLSGDDGEEGYGFRCVRRGKVYGPYNGCERLETRRINRNNKNRWVDTHPLFIDAFGERGNVIAYYRFDGSHYHSSHNQSAEWWSSEGPSGVDSYAKTAGGKHYRTDFILISMGGDEGWDVPRDGGDDITNFFAE